MGQIVQSEILVLGGGPAGATAAIALAKLGHDVTLCEGQAFPRPHVGICLGAPVRRQLAFLGLEALFNRPAHRLDLPLEQRWAESGFHVAAHQRVTIVDRGQFDADLLDAARAAHVRVLQPARIGRLRRVNIGWNAVAVSPSGEVALAAEFLVYAGGRGTGLRRRRLGPSLLALSASWTGAVSNRVRIGTARHAWCWSAPTDDDVTACIVFTGASEFKAMRHQLSYCYLEAASASGVLHGGLSLRGTPAILDASAYVAVTEQGRMLTVGDADLAMEPLSSSGVQAAIQSGLAAGPVVATLLAKDGDHAAAREFWRDRRARRAVQHREWVEQFYAQAEPGHCTPFWQTRAGVPAPPKVDPAGPPLPEQIVRLSPDARIAARPCLTVSRVERLDCIDHAGLSEPAAFVAGQPIAPLLRLAAVPMPAGLLAREWARMTGPGNAMAILDWAWRHGLLMAQ